MPDPVKIVKVDQQAPIPAPATTTGGRKKSMRTFPRGILKRTGKSKTKIEGVRDPAKAPPLRKSTLRILTEKGIEKRRKQIKKTVRTMPDSKVRAVLQKAGMPVSSKTPPHIAKDILESGMEAGMIVVD
jgi:hypothetical protein